MNKKLYIISSLAVFVVIVALNWLLHDVVLSELYEINKSVWRNGATRDVFAPLLFIDYFVVSFVFVFLFARGYRNKGWAEGVRYGLVFGLVMATSSAIEKFVLIDVPARLALGWFMGTLFEFMILGLVTALIYRNRVEGR